MEWLNYHHLLYFWVAAREGSVTRAAAELNVSQPAVSRQIRSLEDSLGERLFRKQGRKLALTDMGRVVLGYAEEIFALGRELRDSVRHGGAGRAARLNVGVVDVVPKLVAYRLIRPAFASGMKLQVVVREDDREHLFAALALHELDLVISDAPITSASAVKAFNHILGDSGIAFLGSAKFEHLRRGFPASLDRAPMLLPLHGTELRRALDHWFESHGVRPEVVGEFEDSALAKAVAHAGIGVVPAPAVIEKEVRRQYALKAIGRTMDVRERFYAISGERRITHPAVLAITQAAKEQLFV